MEMALTFQGHQVRHMIIDGSPWWVAKDVCDVLGVRNSSQCLSYLDTDEKGGAVIDTPSGEQEAAIINEAGLYSLILRSRKPAAKVFKRWVTHEVLPMIRRTGQYSTHGGGELATVIGAFSKSLDGFAAMVQAMDRRLVMLEDAQQATLKAAEREEDTLDWLMRRSWMEQRARPERITLATDMGGTLPTHVVAKRAGCTAALLYDLLLRLQAAGYLPGERVALMPWVVDRGLGVMYAGLGAGVRIHWTRAGELWLLKLWQNRSTMTIAEARKG